VRRGLCDLRHGAVMDGNAWNRIQQTLPSLMNPLAMLLSANDAETNRQADMCSLGVASCTTQFLPAHQTVPFTFLLTGVKSGQVHCKVNTLFDLRNAELIAISIS
jgi:hypothetical protein